MKIEPSLKNIAAACGVSHVTAWRALKNYPNVNPQTAARIRDYANEIGWEEHSDARVASARRRPYTVKKRLPIVVPYNLGNISNHTSLFWDYFVGAADASSRSEHPFEFAGFHDSNTELERLRTLVEKDGVAGILEFSLQPASLDYLRAKAVPFVSYELDVFNPDPKRPARVYADHIQGFVDAWRLLLDKGHERIGFIGNQGSETSQSRLNEGLAAAQLVSRKEGFDTQVLIPRQGGYTAIWQTLEVALGAWPSPQWPTAFFCTNDACAYRVLACLKEHGVKVPQELSVIGFDDTQLATLCDPPLTTIAKPRRKIGEMMVELLTQLIKEKSLQQQICARAIPMHLVERESVAVAAERLTPGDKTRSRARI